jgi:hypothetical protein
MEANGVVLLVKGSSVSKASFAQDPSETELRSETKRGYLVASAALVNSTELQTTRPALLAMMHLRTSGGFWLFIVFVCIVAIVVLVFRRYQERTEIEIYFDDDADAKHEFWSKAHRKPPPLEDEPVPTGILPYRQEYRREPRGARQTKGQASMAKAQLGSQMNMPAASSSSHVQNNQHISQQFLRPADLLQTVGDGIMERGDRAVETAWGGLETGVDMAAQMQQQVAETALSTQSFTKKIYKKIDKATGKTIKSVVRSAEQERRLLAQRWEEAVEQNLYS